MSWEIYPKISKHDSQKLNTMVKRSKDQKIKSRIFQTRNERNETEAG